MNLCRRLELSPREGMPEVASGRQYGAELELRDTGSALWLRVRLPQPLLPPGALLLSERSAVHVLGPPRRLLPLRERSARPGLPGWYVTPEAAGVELEASRGFLDTVAQAAQAHPRMAVEAQWLSQALPAASLPDPGEIRDAAQALQHTGERWLEAVKTHGLPRLEGPPPLELPRERVTLTQLLQSGLAPWLWLVGINGGAPVAVFALAKEVEWLLLGSGIVFVLGLLVAGSQRSRPERHPLAVVALLSLVASFIAPMAWFENERLRSCPRVEDISVRDAPKYPQACWFRFRDGTVRHRFLGEVIIETREGKDKRQAFRAYRVYPVVPEGWTPEEPVTVWSTTASPPKPLQGVPGGTVHMAEAAQVAATRHKLLNHPGAVYLNLTVTKEQALERLEGDALWLWGVPNLLWLMGALVFWGRRSLSS
jgi:hypothetical protein